MGTFSFFLVLLAFSFFVFLSFLIKLIFEKLFLSLAKKTKTKVDDRLIEILEAPVFWSVFLLGVYVLLFTLRISSSFLTFLRKSLVTFGFLIWGLVIIEIARVFFKEIERKVQSEKHTTLPDLLPFLENLTKLTIALVIFLIVLSFWGVDITPALASAGVVGIAVAFAARDTVANLFGGISVFFDKPYKTGDYVIIQNKYRGQVVEIGMRSTKIKTRDNVLLTVPNSVMVTNTVINETGFDPKLRVRIPVGVSYESDLEKVESVLLEIAGKDKDVLEKPPPKVRFRKFADSAIELELLVVISSPAERGRIIHDLIKRIQKKFKEEKIIIPFPQRDVHAVLSLGFEPRRLKKA